MVVGTIERPKENSNPKDHFSGAIQEGSVELVQGADAIYTKTMDILQNYGSLALNDDYTYWHSNHDKSEFGKLFLIDRMDYNTHPIFFDDNVEDEDPHIVDPRDLIDGAQIPWKRVKKQICSQSRI